MESKTNDPTIIEGSSIDRVKGPSSAKSWIYICACIIGVVLGLCESIAGFEGWCGPGFHTPGACITGFFAHFFPGLSRAAGQEADTKKVAIVLLTAGFGLLAYIAYAIRAGRVWYKFQVAERETEPGGFWYVIGFYAIVAGILFFGAIMSLHAHQAPLVAAPVQQALDNAYTAEKQARGKAAEALLVQSQAQRAARAAEAAALRAQSGAAGTKEIDRTCRAPVSGRETPCYYAGEVDAEGKPWGPGVLTWLEGGRFEGEWRDDDRNGIGVMTWPDGHRYEGEWIFDHRNGLGVQSWTDGDRYEGEFSAGWESGPGLYIGGSTKSFREKAGMFGDDQLKGYGLIHYKDGTALIGAFDIVDNRQVLNGYGAMLDAQGHVSEQGLYKGGKLDTAMTP